MTSAKIAAICIRLSPDDECLKEIEVLLGHNQFEDAAKVIAENLTPKAFRQKMQTLLADGELFEGKAASFLPAIAKAW